MLCDNCTSSGDFVAPVLGTSTQLAFLAGGSVFLVIANCAAAATVATLGVGSDLVNWNTALTDLDNFRAFRDCVGLQGGMQVDPADFVTKGACQTPVLIDKSQNFVYTAIFEKDNTASDVYNFLLSLNGQQVYMAYGLCDDNTIFAWQTGTLRLSASTPNTNADNVKYTVEISGKANMNVYNRLNQPFLISELIIP